MPITINGSGTVTGISAGGLPDGCIVTADIADNNVTTAKIDNISVTEIKIADNNVTTTKIADNTITTAKIVNGAVTAAKRSEDLTLETAKSATGTSVDFTGIPSWVKRVTVMFSGVSTNGTSNLMLQLGTSGGVETSTYLGAAWSANTNNVQSSSGFILTGTNAAANLQHGSAIVSNLTSNTWVMQSGLAPSNALNTSVARGSKALSGTLDRLRLTTVNGTDSFDAGTINIMYE
jgi:hypothetical protein